MKPRTIKSLQMMTIEGELLTLTPVAPMVADRIVLFNGVKTVFTYALPSPKIESPTVTITAKDSNDARRMVERRRRLHDPVAEADPLRALRNRREEHLGRARVRILLQEMMLDFPDVIDPERVRELDLIQRVLS